MKNAKANAPFAACGHEIQNPAGFPVVKVHAGEAIESIQNTLYIVQLVQGCSQGADVTITPPTIAHIVASIRAADGKLVAIEVDYPGLMDTRVQGTLTVRFEGRILGTQAICPANSTNCPAKSPAP